MPKRMEFGVDRTILDRESLQCSNILVDVRDCICDLKRESLMGR